MQRATPSTTLLSDQFFQVRSTIEILQETCQTAGNPKQITILQRAFRNDHVQPWPWVRGVSAAQPDSVSAAVTP